VSVLPRQNGPVSNSTKKAECKFAPSHKPKIDLGYRLATLRLDCFLISFRGEFFGHGFLELFSIHSIAFGSVHKNIVAAGIGTSIRRIQQADFQKQLAKLGLVVGAYLLGQKLLRGRRVFLRLYLVRSIDAARCRLDGIPGNENRGAALFSK
jgi:hypothetical protein